MDPSYNSTHNSARRTKNHFRRAKVACTECRRSKTRCIYLSSQVCYRCKNLNRQCSLGSIQDSSTEVGDEQAMAMDLDVLDNDRLAALERKIEEIHQDLKLLRNKPSASLSIGTMSPSNRRDSSGDIEGESPFESSNLDSSFFNSTPFRDVRAVSSFFGLSFSRELACGVRVDLESRNLAFQLDIIDKDIVSYDLALHLVGLCKRHYGRWCSLPDLSLSELVDSMRKDSPLLLSVCCYLGLSYYNGDA
jgi:hypothetical protein